MSMRFFALIAALILLCSGCGVVPPDTTRSAVSASPAHSAADRSFVPDISVSAEPVAPPIPMPPPADTTPDPTPQEENTTPDSVPPAEVAAPEPTPKSPELAEPIEPVEPVYEPDVPAIHVPAPIPDDPAYDFSVPAAEGPAVESSYFADAAFVGDSRTEGFWLYSGVKQGKLLGAVGLTVFSIDTKQATGSSQTVLDALCTGNFNKIYLGFGLNELGYIDTESFVQTYCQLIDTIRTAHPQALIYIQNLIPVNDAQARASGHKGHVNCERIRLYNEMLAQIALDKQLPLLDLYSAFVVDGQLPAEASRDGVHLLPSYCKKQLDYLKTHTVSWEQLTAPALPQPPEPVEPAPVPTPEAPTETEVTEI